MWDEFVVGCRLSPGSSFHKNQPFKFQFDQDRGAAWKPGKADMASSLNIVTLFLKNKANPWNRSRTNMFLLMYVRHVMKHLKCLVYESIYKVHNIAEYFFLAKYERE